MEWYNECKSKVDYSIDLLNNYGDVWLELFKKVFENLILIKLWLNFGNIGSKYDFQWMHFLNLQFFLFLIK